MSGAMDRTAADASLRLLNGQRIFFGHQSVGQNILDGIGDVSRSAGTALTIKEISETTGIVSPVFAHARIGANQNPNSKIDAFAAVLRGGIAEQLDVAFMKLCYVDVKAGTDIEAVLAHYRHVHTQLAAEFPNVLFVHFTVPITVMPSWPQRALRTLLAKPRTKAIDDNLARAEYNRRMRDLLGPDAAIFDLAAVESTTPSGRANVFRWQGREFRALLARYSDDGRHLGPLGRRVVASALVEFIAAQVRRRASVRDAA
jgi:hypothetical protein